MPIASRIAACPACSHHVCVTFFDGGAQPLATLSWPATAREAEDLPRHALDFVRCVRCGHVFNAAFDYANVPYSSKPNLMFNAGALWSVFVRDLCEKLCSLLPERPVTVIEIGHGDGGFLAALSKLRPESRFIGFDPHGAKRGAGNVELRAELFLPDQHLPELEPDLIVSRHVLEHLMNPLGFLQEISFAASQRGCSPLAYFETPCIDRAIDRRRLVDFYYEHASQFTTESFSRMLESAVADVVEIGHGYDGEVVYGVARLGVTQHTLDIAREGAAFSDASKTATGVIRAQLADLHASEKSVVIWGGTGKSAAFMCHYGVDAARFPIVVDSDPAKVGTFVPGTGQEIRSRDWVKANPVDVVIIPPQWRARDILLEIERLGVAAPAVLIEDDGRLVDPRTQQTPYFPK